MQYFEVGGMTLPVIGHVERKNGDTVPMVEINMMSDERWKQITEESAVKHFREWYGREPESVQEAFEGEREYVSKFWHEIDNGELPFGICKELKPVSMRIYS